MKSSQLLKHMWCHLEPHKLPENILRQLWLYELPNNVTQILTPCLELTELNEVAGSSDRICENAGTHNTIQNPINEQSDQIQQF